MFLGYITALTSLKCTTSFAYFLIYIKVEVMGYDYDLGFEYHFEVNSV